MKVAPKVIVLVSDADGSGPAISHGLDARPGSGLSRESSRVHLSLEKYGVKDRGVAGDLIHFLDRDGSLQVSIIVLPNYEPPISACAVNEILSLIVAHNSSELVTIMIPWFLPSQKIIQDSIDAKFAENGVTLFGTEIGLVTDSTQSALIGIPRPPPSLQINCETLACLLQMIRVLKMPALLVGTMIMRQTLKAKAQDVQALNELGEFLANCTGLCFFKDKICWREGEKLSAQEPWRALYG